MASGETKEKRTTEERSKEEQSNGIRWEGIVEEEQR